jgi:hypothetical protein
MSVVLLALGAAVVVLTAANVLFTMVLPRRPFGLDRLTLVFVRSVQAMFERICLVARSYEGRDAILSTSGPVALGVQLAGWAGGFVVGFGFMIGGVNGDLGGGLLQSLTSLFTVGAVHPGGRAIEWLDISAGAVWPVVVALQIAYLPALYSAFSRREALVALLESRAGLPAWGPELLVRHQLVGIIDTLPELYSSWEEWAAEVAESHTTYPVLLLFRSPESWYSWVVGLLAVLDAAAIHLAVSPESASSEARLCLRMGFTLFDRIALSLGWSVDPDPDPDGSIALTFAEYEKAMKMLGDVGFPMHRNAEESWPDFRGWRVNYEAVAYRLADFLTAPPAPWSGTRRNLRTGVVMPRRPPQRHPGEHPRRPHALGARAARGTRRRTRSR